MNILCSKRLSGCGITLVNVTLSYAIFDSIVFLVFFFVMGISVFKNFWMVHKLCSIHSWRKEFIFHMHKALSITKWHLLMTHKMLKIYIHERQATNRYPMENEYSLYFLIDFKGIPLENLQPYIKSMTRACARFI